ncbi:hypothetical protein QR680_016460 [Steinernema hermaphroditum]|uniref:Uncharacterized protein n=1 Tax=Steinernema hermaphroditum TaxID=289476 RepID=A0AA39HD95_9BILA|nr:hypothetical protein QR680_016460 [Steinernema hermaphroditum]
MDLVDAKNDEAKPPPETCEIHTSTESSSSVSRTEEKPSTESCTASTPSASSSTSSISGRESESNMPRARKTPTLRTPDMQIGRRGIVMQQPKEKGGIGKHAEMLQQLTASQEPSPPEAASSPAAPSTTRMAPLPPLLLDANTEQKRRIRKKKTDNAASSSSAGPQTALSATEIFKAQLDKLMAELPPPEDGPSSSQATKPKSPTRKTRKKLTANERLREEIAELQEKNERLKREDQELDHELVAIGEEKRATIVAYDEDKMKYNEILTSNIHIREHYTSAVAHERSKIGDYIKGLRALLSNHGVDPGEEQPRDYFVTKRMTTYSENGEEMVEEVDGSLPMPPKCQANCHIQQLYDDHHKTASEVMNIAAEGEETIEVARMVEEYSNCSSDDFIVVD